jgi:antirestriction protein ArdC
MNPKCLTETAPQKTDVYDRVTNHIVTQLEQGVRPWFQPWSGDHLAGRISRPLRANGVAYRGINTLMLWAASVERGYQNPRWLTFKQAVEFGAHVRKGEKGTLVVYADRITKTETDSVTGEDHERDIPFLKAYTAFNAEQVEGLPAQFHAASELARDPLRRIQRAEAFCANTGARIEHGGARAFYSLREDKVQLPPFEAFRDAEAYYATLAHELTHWTKAPSRLDREFGRKRFGDAGYAMEELVAELGAAFLCADLDLSPEPREEHASYLGHWLSVMKADKRAIFSAAAHAQRAADYLHNLQPKSEEMAA